MHNYMVDVITVKFYGTFVIIITPVYDFGTFLTFILG